MGRASIVLLCIFLASIVIIGGFVVDSNSPWGNILFNLGSEIIGIVLTVAIIDVLLEQRQNKEKAAKFAKSLLFTIDEFIHEWLGGKREFSVDEMLKLLTDITSINEKEFNITKLNDLGQTANSVLRLGSEIYKTSPSLKKALEQLSIFDGMKKDSLSPIDIAKHLRIAVEYLIRDTGTKLLL